MRKNRNILLGKFGILFLVLSIILLQLLGNQTLEADTTAKEGNLNKYPSTPEGVVEAFCKVSFEVTNIRGVGNSGDVGEKLQFTTYSGKGGFDGFPIARKYRVIKLKEDAKEARVKVEYECIGDLSGLDLLEIREETVEEKYLLEKIKGFWKIIATDHPPYISVKTAIRLLEWGIETYKRETDRVKKMRENIRVLEEFANSSDQRKGDKR